MQYDLAIAGGGIVGAGVARAAARAGLKVALFEKDDFGAGTTSRSSRLIHGGIRYLEHMEFGLVRQALAERRRLLRMAPHLVRPIPFLLPVYRRQGHPYLMLWAGMAIYDGLSLFKHLPHHQALSAAECRRLEPSLAPEGLRGGFLYYDAQCAFPERLCLENVLDAERHGALVRNHTRVAGLVVSDGRVDGVRFISDGDAHEEEVHARYVLNATGPWVDGALAAWDVKGPARLRRSKGVHIVVPSVTKHALVMETKDEKRVFFAIPWGRFTLIGTTDHDFDGDTDDVTATEAEVRELLAEARRFLKPAPRRTDVLYTTAGLRALPATDDADVSAITRRHVLIDHASEAGPRGLWSVLGGKISTYRAIAEEVLDEMLGRGWRPDGSDDEADALLPGGVADWQDARQRLVTEARTAGIDDQAAEALADMYGARASEVIALAANDPGGAKRLDAPRPEIAAAIEHAVDAEHARTVEDFMLRRTTLGLSEDSGLGALEAVGALMAKRLRWSPARLKREKAMYRRRVGGMHGAL